MRSRKLLLHLLHSYKHSRRCVSPQNLSPLQRMYKILKSVKSGITLDTNGLMSRQGSHRARFVLLKGGGSWRDRPFYGENISFPAKQTTSLFSDWGSEFIVKSQRIYRKKNERKKKKKLKEVWQRWRRSQIWREWRDLRDLIFSVLEFYS